MVIEVKINCEFHGSQEVESDIDGLIQCKKCLEILGRKAMKADKEGYISQKDSDSLINKLKNQSPSFDEKDLQTVRDLFPLPEYRLGSDGVEKNTLYVISGDYRLDYMSVRGLYICSYFCIASEKTCYKVFPGLRKKEALYFLIYQIERNYIGRGK